MVFQKHGFLFLEHQEIFGASELKQSTAFLEGAETTLKS